MEDKNALQITRAEEDHGRDRSRVEATEGLQSGQNPEERGEGVRKRGSSKSEIPRLEEEVAAAYAVTVDGWIEISHRAIRNSESPQIVWMTLSTWNILATCATDRGLFFIPCSPGCQTVDDLRCLVASKEISNGG